MEVEDFENVSSELKAIYIQYGLEDRRRRHYEKVGYSNFPYVPNVFRVLLIFKQITSFIVFRRIAP